MDYFRQTIVSNKLSGIFELPPVLRNRQVEVIILPVENDVEKKPNYALKLGFLKDKVPPLPDSFFEPLPEEELQAWGL
jgi:hypothetical protein